MTWERPEWHHQGLCRTPEVLVRIRAKEVSFFGESGISTQAAREICVPCPVKDKCLEYAIEHPSWTKLGVWGGTTEKERRRIRYNMTTRGLRSVCGTMGGYKRHGRNNETPCDECKEARRKYDHRRGVDVITKGG